MKSAVLMMVFNRPDTTRQVFDAVRAARPPRLYLSADGPRPDKPDEAAMCMTVRQIVTEVDWPCEVKTRFHADNQGCKKAPSGAVSWFFEHEEEGLILEDDCLPSASFFPYCDALLERFRDDNRIWQICGTNMFGRDPSRADQASYRFSRYGPVWGWATWRRAWRHYDPDIKDWPLMSRPEIMQSVYDSPVERSARLALGNKLFSGEMNSCWDYQWGMTKNFNHGLSVVPTSNLIRNIGFGPGATHTTSTDQIAPKDFYEIPLPLRHPAFVLPDAIQDRRFLSLFLGTDKGRLKRLAAGLVRRIAFGVS